MELLFKLGIIQKASGGARRFAGSTRVGTEGDLMAQVGCGGNAACQEDIRELKGLT